MSNVVRVEKIGGDDSFQMRTTLELLRSRGAEKGVYIFSAFKNSLKGEEFNTTTSLTKIGKSISEGLYSEVFEEFSLLRAFYQKVIEREFSDDEEMRENLALLCGEQFDLLESMIRRHESIHMDKVSAPLPFDLPNETNDYAFIFERQKISLLGFGEILTTKLFGRALLGSTTLDVSHIPLSVKTPARYSPIKDIYETVGKRTHEALEQSNAVLLPGYVGFIPGGILASFGRGYSDATASHAYRRLSEQFTDEHFELAIKKLFVICSADPRIVGVDNVRVIRVISLRLLLEMIGARGACGPFVNRNAVSPALFQNGGFIRLYSESDPTGSIITLDGDAESEGVLFIQSKPVSVITIVSYHMNQEGYIEKVGEFFKEYHISIDNIVSSETSITLTINEKDLKEVNMENLLGKLRENLGSLEESGEEGDMEINHAPLSEIYIGGENIDSPGLMMEISTILAEQGINIATNMQPMNPRVVIVGVSREREQDAVKLLHRKLIERAGT